MQRAKVQEALGLLRAIDEMFGIEDNSRGDISGDLERWQEHRQDFENWVFVASPLA